MYTRLPIRCRRPQNGVERLGRFGGLKLANPTPDAANRESVGTRIQLPPYDSLPYRFTRSLQAIQMLRLAVAMLVSLVPAVAETLSAQSSPSDSVAARGDSVRALTAPALLARARAARLRVDSALQSYDALARERFTLSLSIRGSARERVLTRDESAGRVRWTRERGVRVDVLGRRRVSNSPFGDGGGQSADASIPVPYFPGKEPLWGIGSAFISTTTDDQRTVHPLAIGAESFYRYAMGDSVSIRLPDGSRIVLHELRATPRSASWRVLSASLWFESGTAQLVRAAYRYSTPIDLLFEARKNPDPANRPSRWLSLVASPLRATLEAVTVESGLFEGRYWLPRQQVADFRVDAPSESVVRGRQEQRFQYESVNGTLELPAALPPATLALRARSDSVWIVDSTREAMRDSLLKTSRNKRDSAKTYADYRVWSDSSFRPIRAQLDSLRTAQCAQTGTYARYRSRYGRRLPAEVYVPCDSVALTRAAIFEGELFGRNDGVWGSGDRDALIKSLASVAPLSWSPQPLRVVTGLEFARYNRVEGASLGGALRQDVGPGLRWEANLRASVADRQLNGELFLDRAVAGASWRIGGYRRLTQADDYGAAFVLGASLQNLVSGLDERFYYRAAGLDVQGTRNRSLGGGALTWRLFAEHQSAAVARADWVIARLWNSNAGFAGNIVDTLGGGTRGVFAGASVRWRGSRGDEASAWRLSADSRTEVASGVDTYGRSAMDLAVEKRLPLNTRAVLSGGVGASLGGMPVQRFWNLGGWQTVRGYVSGTQRGDAFWIGRGELLYEGLRRFQPSVFVDQGWAGARSALFTMTPQLRSAGAGVAVFGGLFRLDAARPLDAGGTWRVNAYAITRF